MNTIKVKQIRSVAGRLKAHKMCIRGLGLGKIGSVSTLEDTPSIRGMINKVSYLVTIES
jgi:large subunit ribosomal protein L30